MPGQTAEEFAREMIELMRELEPLQRKVFMETIRDVAAGTWNAVSDDDERQEQMYAWATDRAEQLAAGVTL